MSTVATHAAPCAPRHVFGPVPSRRLGRSLGIDPIPAKTCNWNCVYCQLGRTGRYSTDRREWLPKDEILAEAATALAHHEHDVDWVTFVGAGEPTLHAALGDLICAVRRMTAAPVAVITNGSLLHRDDVRTELATADAVLPSLDAGTERLYLRLNRPAPGTSFREHVDGLVAFRERYVGRLWVEVMLVRGMNDTPQALHDLAAVLRLIEPDEIHVSVPVRPPSESWVHAPDDAAVARAAEILGAAAHVVLPTSGTFDLSGFDDPLEAVVAVVARHPMREDEALDALTGAAAGPGSAPRTRADANRAVAELVREKHARIVVRDGQRFLAPAAGRYGASREPVAR